MAVCNIFQMTLKHTNVFHSKALQILPKVGFFCLKIYHLATLLLSTELLTRFYAKPRIS
jgi:hypothetical protein